MSVPVDLAPEAEDQIDVVQVNRAIRTGRALGWRSRLDAAITSIGDEPTGYPILFEQPTDPSVPRFREMLHRDAGGVWRVVFRFDGVRVRVVEFRPATARPLTGTRSPPPRPPLSGRGRAAGRGDGAGGGKLRF